MNNTQGQTEIARHALRRAMRDALGIREEGIPPHSEGVCETSRPAETRSVGKPETPEKSEVSQATENLITGAKQGQVGDAAGQNPRVEAGQEELLITGAEQGPSESEPPPFARGEEEVGGGEITGKKKRRPTENQSNKNAWYLAFLRQRERLKKESEIHSRRQR